MINNEDSQKKIPEIKSEDNEKRDGFNNDSIHHDFSETPSIEEFEYVNNQEQDENGIFNLKKCESSKSSDTETREYSVDLFMKEILNLKNEQTELSKKQDQLIQLVIEQNKLFKTKLLQDEQKEGLIDKMHSELQVLRSNLHKNLVKPVLIDIIRLRENMRKMESDLNKKYPDGLIPSKIFSDYLIDLADILEEHNVEIFEENPGTKFIPIKQKVINRLITSDKNMSGIIVQSISSGYCLYDQVISPQKVDVFYYIEKTIHENDSPIDNIQT